MIEEFYLIDQTQLTFHFRHNERANGVFLDGHVEKLKPANFDTKLKEQNIGNIDWTLYPDSL